MVFEGKMIAPCFGDAQGAVFDDRNIAGPPPYPPGDLTGRKSGLLLVVAGKRRPQVPGPTATASHGAAQARTPEQT